MRGKLITGFSVIWLLCTVEAEIQGQDQAWSPYRASRRSSYTPLRSAPARDVSPVSLGAPIRRASKPHYKPAPAPQQIDNAVSWGNPRGRRPRWVDTEPTTNELPINPVEMIAARSRVPIYRGQAPDSVAPPSGVGDIPGAPPPPPPPPPPPSADPLFGNEPFNNGMLDQYPGKKKGGFGAGVRDFFCASDCKRGAFQSDPFFTEFSSPITSPFLTEDPRALTEIRPIFMYQTIPNNNPRFQGGDLFFYGVQARLALSERWSIVLNKLGAVSFLPDNEMTGFSDNTSFAEIWVGPKWTFYRNDRSNTIVAAGATLQIPTGGSGAAQNTGELSVAPYISFGQGFDLAGGRLNFINTTGYAISVDNQRSDYFYSNFHIDYGILGKLYPTLEVNWTHFTGNGNSNAQDFEGGDIINFGANDVEGNDLVTIAPGIRYKFTECLQAGAAVEFPITGRKDINDFRFTMDLIWRY